VLTLTVDSMGDRRTIFEQAISYRSGAHWPLDVSLRLLADQAHTEVGLLLRYVVVGDLK
jgi:hypothetical protein